MFKKLIVSFSLTLLLIVATGLSISVYAENDIPDIIELRPDSQKKEH